MQYLTDVGFVISLAIGTVAALLYIFIRRNNS
ncbi:EYxxD motif small membrane protein [Halobacillus andaensis]